MTTFYYNSECENIHMLLGGQLDRLLSGAGAYERDIVVMCIGSDRSTGDSLGPIIGYHLADCDFDNVYIYGDIYNTINATNLGCSINEINRLHRNPFIIAIDACLGKEEHIGYITLANGPLSPGTGAANDLPKVGNLHITGIVNTFSNDASLLHSTRLRTVITIAKAIENSLLWVFR